MTDSLQPHGLQHARPPCPSPTPETCWNSCPWSRWCHPTISSSVVPLSFHLQSFPASGSFQMSQFFTSGGQRIGTSASASVLPMNIQDLFPLGLTGLISLQSKGLSRVFSSTTVQKYQFCPAQLWFSLQSWRKNTCPMLGEPFKFKLYILRSSRYMLKPTSAPGYLMIFKKINEDNSNHLPRLSTA